MEKKTGSKDGTGISSKRRLAKAVEHQEEAAADHKEGSQTPASRTDRSAKRSSVGTSGKKVGKSATGKKAVGSTAKKVNNKSVKKSKASKNIKKGAATGKKGGK